jgi:hypothetical protein
VPLYISSVEHCTIQSFVPRDEIRKKYNKQKRRKS